MRPARSISLARKVWWLIRHGEHELEYNPEVQWRFHRRMCWFWLANFPIITILFFFFPRAWIVVALFINTYYSLYANFCTEFDGVHSSYAGWRAQQSHELLEQQGRRDRAQLGREDEATIEEWGKGG